LQKSISLAAVQKTLGHDRLVTATIYLNITDMHIMKNTTKVVGLSGLDHMRLCWLMCRALKSMLWEQVSSTAYAGLLRALTVVFKAEFQSVFELANRVS
jgi:hypothetical protein